MGVVGYGFFFVVFGGGFIVGVLLLWVVCLCLGVNGVFLVLMVGFGVFLCVLLLMNSLWVVGFVMVGVGMGWIGVIVMVNGVV